jgi:hypothetical protein
MADNERVAVVSNDLDPQQQSVAQANRTEWYPGKAVSREGDMNWERDKRIPQGTPAFDGEAAGPVEMNRTRVVKLHRNTVSDQTVLAPTVESVRVEAVTDDYISGTNTVQETENPPNLAERERRAGNDNIKGA